MLRHARFQNPWQRASMIPRGRLGQVLPRLWTNFCHDLSARAFLARPTVNLDRHRTTRLIWMTDRMKNTTRNLSVKIENRHPLEATPSVSAIVKLVIEGAGRQRQFGTWKGSRRRSHSRDHGQQDPPSQYQSQSQRRSLHANEASTALAAARRMLNHWRHGPFPVHCQITSPRTDPRRKPMPESATLSHPTLSQTQAAPISCYIVRLGKGILNFSCGRPYGSWRMRLRRSIRISSSDTRRGWASGLQEGPLRRESEHGPLFQSLEDHHIRKRRGSAKYRVCRMGVCELLLFHCCLVCLSCCYIWLT
ncbi:hypothetical protein I7I48_08986 [Histoplasma ohiense]|nr:hypothetical protein I7I48_08986 [Histoplasma ohiense (nom. inval.)]